MNYEITKSNEKTRNKYYQNSIKLKRLDRSVNYHKPIMYDALNKKSEPKGFKYETDLFNVNVLN